MYRQPKRLFGLIGKTLGHSFSQDYFNNKFEAEGTDARYINFELPDIGDLMELISEYPTLQGLNVTIPYKEQVIPYMDELDDAAREIGAVNVIKFINPGTDDFRMKGYNSDMIGFQDSISPMLTSIHRRALVLGTGGAAKAVAYALRKLGLEVRYVSRTAGNDRITYADLTPEIMKSHLVIVNTTPLGMYPDVETYPDIPYDELTADHICYDLLYNPDTTMFMRKSAAHGATVKNGLEMLLLQAFAAWQIWNS